MRAGFIAAALCLLLLPAPAQAETYNGLTLDTGEGLPLCTDVLKVLGAPLNEKYMSFSPDGLGERIAKKGEKDDLFFDGTYASLATIQLKQVDLQEFAKVNAALMSQLRNDQLVIDRDFIVTSGLSDIDGDGERERIYTLQFLKPYKTFGHVFMGPESPALQQGVAAADLTYVFQSGYRAYGVRRNIGEITIFEMSTKNPEHPELNGTFNAKAVCHITAAQ
ncbi:MAG: hypothetical protein PW788_07180 [Micavibrio sp.]|nr:hypothetical protein [Micavibrio sp.]